MPNWVSNIVKVEGLSEKDLFTKYEDGSVGFDFNKLIQMPPELDVTDGGITDVAIDSVISLFGYKPRSPWYDKSVEQFVKEGRFQELLNQGLQYITNRVKYGATTWYDWCNQHWILNGMLVILNIQVQMSYILIQHGVPQILS